MREKPIEMYLRDQVRLAGGECLKWVSPGHAGVPDRICLFADSRIHFVETKATDGRLSPGQEWTHRRLRQLGFAVWVINSKEQVDTFICALRS